MDASLETMEFISLYQKTIQQLNLTGYVKAVEIAPLPLQDQANITLDKGKTVKSITLHDILGHVGEYASRLTANYYNWKIQGKLSCCES